MSVIENLTFETGDRRCGLKNVLKKLEVFAEEEGGQRRRGGTLSRKTSHWSTIAGEKRGLLYKKNQDGEKLLLPYALASCNEI